MHCRILARRLPLIGTLLTGALLSACADRGADQRAADSDLARDLALVQSSARAQPVFRDTALTSAPAARRDAVTPRVPAARPAVGEVPAARPRPRRPARAVRQREAQRPTRVAEVPPPEPREAAPQPAPAAERAGQSAAGAIGAGTVLEARSNARVCTRSNLPGDRITATVNAPVRGTNGAEIPAGAEIVLEVTSINAADAAESGEVVFRVTSVAIGGESYPASGGATATGPLEPAQTGRSASSDRKKVIGGAIAGAILGQMMGKDTRSTVIGAAAGAAAGTAAAKMGEKRELCLAAGTPMRITLDEAVVLH
ncbi:MAG: YMGG-like glycine zipper-containing protein [Gemmatimonadaceae bacterium]